jgi:hypothetical protein
LSSFATNTNLALKVDKVTGKGLSSEDYSTAEKAKLGSISGTNTGVRFSSFATNTNLASKVDKVVGKGLSSEEGRESQTRFNLRYQYRDQDLSSFAKYKFSFKSR